MLHTRIDTDLVKASARKTPQPTPVPLSGDQTSEQVIGTTQRLSNLRRDCLIRDRHRCVISHKFDIREGKEHAKRDGDNAKDDDGQLLKHDREGAEFLEVAHILPHSLTLLASSRFPSSPQIDQSLLPDKSLSLPIDQASRAAEEFSSGKLILSDIILRFLRTLARYCHGERDVRS
jgi:hypothetical protein